MASRCEECRGRLRDGGHRTATRTLCDACHARFLGAAAGIISGGTVASAVSTAGWYEKLRRARRDS